MGFQTGLGFGKNAVKERIVAVMTMKKTTFIGILATVIALTSAFTVFVTNTVSDTLVVLSLIHISEPTRPY